MNIYHKEANLDSQMDSYKIKVESVSKTKLFGLAYNPNFGAYIEYKTIKHIIESTAGMTA